MAQDLKQSIADLYRSDSPVGTELLRLFHTLVRDTNPGGSKSYLITSATVGEGKSTVAALLALTLATLKKKTLLVDSDLRRPTIHKLFNLYLENGVTEIADRTLETAKAFKDTNTPGLRVLTAGRLAKDPSTYFEEGGVSRILAAVRPYFDFIVVDCAPVLPVIDPITILKDMTGVLLVVKAGETHRELAKQAVDALTKVGAPIVGVLLNDEKGVLPYQHRRRYAYEYYHSAE